MHGEPTGLLAELVEAAPVAVGVVDSAGRLVLVNAALAELVGEPDRQRLLGGRPEVVLPGLPDALLEELERVRRDGGARRGLPVDVRGRAFRCDVFRLAGDGAVACLVVETTEQRRLEAERSLALARLALTSRASELLATTLEPAVVLEHLCDLLVPALADHVWLDLHEEGGRLRRAAIRHVAGVEVDPSLQRPVGELSAYAPGHPIRVAVETGRHVAVRDVRAAEGAIPPTDDTELLRRLGVTSVLVVPMVVAGRVVGTAGMVNASSGRLFEPDDVATAEEVVRRAAVALDNARSYAQQRRAAVALQRSLMPAALPSPDELGVAWRYEPGTLGTEVGGDWVDVLELPGGRIAVVVGDVMGRGLRAAAVMGQLRTAVRTLALQDPPPADLLTRLDSIVLGLPGDQLVTCVYAVYDPARGRLTTANAGHVPPLLREPGGAVRVLGEPVDPPLGVGPAAGADAVRVEVDHPFPSGALLAMLTDGLVERRGADLDADLSALAGGLALAPGDPEDVADALVRTAPQQGAGYADDVALLVVRATPEDDAARCTSVAAVPESVSEARRFLLRALADWGADDDLASTAELLVSEVVTNAVRYASGDAVELVARRSGGRGGAWRVLWVEVVDADTRQPRLRQAALDDEGGRGLALVHALSAAWGSRPTPDGKAVWFRLQR